MLVVDYTPDLSFIAYRFTPFIATSFKRSLSLSSLLRLIKNSPFVMPVPSSFAFICRKKALVLDKLKCFLTAGYSFFIISSARTLVGLLASFSISICLI